MKIALFCQCLYLKKCGVYTTLNSKNGKTNQQNKRSSEIANSHKIAWHVRNRTAYPPRAPGFTQPPIHPSAPLWFFRWGPCCSSFQFSVLCCFLFCFVSLHPVSCFQCCQLLRIVHSLLPSSFSHALRSNLIVFVHFDSILTDQKCNLKSMFICSFLCSMFESAGIVWNIFNPIFVSFNRTRTHYGK